MKLDLKTLPTQLLAVLQRLRHYTVFGFFLLLAAVYGFVLFRITTLSSAQPSEDAVNSQLKVTPRPHIDSSVVSQLEQLQDNSVSVKALFDQARDNPFQ